MNRNFIIAIPVIIAAAVIILLASGALYIIDESQQVVITQFGEIIGDPITDPGLHVKMPFVQDANYFDKRVLDWEGEKTVSKTLEQKFINVETYARWRIIDPKLFLQTVSGRFETALSRLDAIIDPIVRDVIARYTLNELVRSDTKKPIMEKILKGMGDITGALEAPTAMDEQGSAQQQDRQAQTRPLRPQVGEGTEDTSLLVDQEIYEERESWITRGRDHITREIFNSAREQVKRFGIDLIDVRVKRINYQPETRRQVYNRMIAERRRQEALYISQGEQQAAQIQGRKDREVKFIQSKAAEEVLRVIGQGEAQATDTYARAYSKDASFYGFLKTLETLRNTVSKDTWLIISTESDFYRILKGAGAQ